MKILMKIIEIMLLFKKSECNLDLTHVSGGIFGRYSDKGVTDSEKDSTYMKVRELLHYYRYTIDGNTRIYNTPLNSLEVIILGYMYELKIGNYRQFDLKCMKLQELKSSGVSDVELIAELFRDSGRYHVIERVTERYLNKNGWLMASDNAFRLRDVLNDKAIRGKYVIPDYLKTKEIIGIVNKYKPKLNKTEIRDESRKNAGEIMGGLGYTIFPEPYTEGLKYDKDYIDKVLELI